MKNEIRDISDQAMELTLAIERCQAVIHSFADEYIDCDDNEIITSVTMRTQHYCNLFNVITYQIDDIRKQAAMLEGSVNNIYKEKTAG